jgi:hypothetical protein
MALHNTKNNIDLKTAPEELSNASSEGAVSASVESPFDTEQESIFKINNFVGNYFDVKKQHMKFETLQGYNKVLPFSFSDTELKVMYERLIEETKTEVSPTLSFAELMEQQFPKARFTIEPFFEAGTVNMISAPPNTWKSWLLFYFSSHIAGGTAPFDKFVSEQSKVMIVNEEDSFRAIQDRFKILDITDTTLPIFFRVANGAKLESKFVDKLLEELQEKQIGVVIFDSLRSMHEADENDSTAMQKILDQLKRIAREGITVIFTHHHRKKGMFEKTSSAESSRGSSAINAAISGHLSLDEEERDNGLFLIVKHLKSKAGEKLDPFEVRIVKADNKIKLVYEGEFKQAEKKIMEVKGQIMDILGDNKWHCKKDFNEQIVVGKNNLIQALSVLKNDGLIVSISRKEAITKNIPVREKGSEKEIYYSLNTESAEITMTKEEAMQQDEFDNWGQNNE